MGLEAPLTDLRLCVILQYRRGGSSCASPFPSEAQIEATKRGVRVNEEDIFKQIS